MSDCVDAIKPGSAENDVTDLCAQFESFNSELYEHLSAQGKHPRCSIMSQELKQISCKFLAAFLPLSRPALYMEFNQWHQRTIHCDGLILLLGHRLACALAFSEKQEQLLLLRILGILMRNADNRVSLEKYGHIRTIMDILKPDRLHDFPRQEKRSMRDCSVRCKHGRKRALAAPTLIAATTPATTDENVISLNSAFSGLSVCDCDSPERCYHVTYPDAAGLIDLREEACVVLRRLALDMRPAKTICELNGIVVMLGLIADRSNSLELREKACSVLGNSFCSGHEKEHFRANNGFFTLLLAIDDSIKHVHYLEVYCRALANAIANCTDNKREFIACGGVQHILANISSQPLHTEFLTMALRVLTNVSRCPEGITDIATFNGMHRLVHLTKYLDEAHMRHSVDRGVLYCVEEIAYNKRSLQEFYECSGVDALIRIMRRVGSNPKLLQGACKTAREVVCASKRDDSAEIHPKNRVDPWLCMINEAVFVMENYPYKGTYDDDFTLEMARVEARPVISCEPGPPHKRVRFHFCHLIQDIVDWFPVRARRHVDRVLLNSLSSPKHGISAFDVLPRELLQLLCEFLPIREWTC